jgi:hypothetical protein
MIRFNPHYHCIVLEGGIDETRSFHHIPLNETSRLTEFFRRQMIKHFVERGAALPQFCGAQFCGAQFCGAQFCVEGSFLETLRVFGV